MANEPKVVENPDLVAALKELHENKTPENQNKVLTLILHKATFLAPAKVQSEGEADEQGRKKSMVQFMLITNKEGQNYMPAFTDVEELRKYVKEDSDTKILPITFDQYVTMLQREGKVAGLVINPMGISMTLEKERVLKLAEQKKIVMEKIAAAQGVPGMKVIDQDKIHNEKLVEGIKELHESKDLQKQQEVLNTLIHEAKLLAPVQAGEAAGEGKQNVRFRVIVTNEGKHLLPAFTDVNELKKFLKEGDEPQILVVDFDHYARMLDNDQTQPEGVVVNPAGLSLTLNREMIRALSMRKQGLLQREEGDTAMMVADPLLVPVEALKAISELAAQRGDITTMWLRQLVRPDGVQRYMLVVDHTGEQAEILAAIQETASKFETKLPLDAIPFHSEFAKSSVEDVEPFYTKEG